MIKKKMDYQTVFTKLEEIQKKIRAQKDFCAVYVVEILQVQLPYSLIFYIHTMHICGGQKFPKEKISMIVNVRAVTTRPKTGNILLCTLQGCMMIYG